MKPTPFYPRTSQLCDSYSWTEWAGWLSANLYELDHTQEYIAIRTSCGVFDTSPLYKYNIHGRDALRLMNRVVTQDVSRLAVAQSLYTPWCDDEGKLIDDGILACLKTNYYRLTAAEPTLQWLQDNAIGLDVTIEEVTDAFAILALQGPYSRDLLNLLADDNLDSLRYFRLLDSSIGDIPVTISRTGFTGDLGYEIWVASHQAVALWDILFEAGRAYRLRPFGEYALDMARIEAGYLVAGRDFYSSKKMLYDFEKSSPLELGLEWTVKLNKDYFVGQQALKREKAQGLKWETVGLDVDLKSLTAIFAEYGMPLYLPYQAWGDAVPVYKNDRQIGKATSGTWSPMLKKYIAIARLKPRYASPGTQVDMEMTIDAQRKTAVSTVVKTPFFNPSRKTSTGGTLR
ncbi:MAG: aminomethyl transferase family protein [Chloroflexi bacterium]|nr:aminomethyl transferase family protein [Chloroflexota bacterium]